MAKALAHAEVRLWGKTVGGVAELDSGRILFEYDEEFRRSGLEISPIHLPLERAGPQSFEELMRQPGFAGLPGVLADALPDAFGNRVMRAYFEARGQSQKAWSPVQKLLYVGERALGALTFHPSEDLPLTPAERQPLELVQLVQDARKIIQGKPGLAIPEIYRIGSSAGGMRPKAVVLYNEESDEIRSAYAPARPGDVSCILKFDGVGEGADADSLGAPAPYNRVEAAYGILAREAGLDASDIRVLEQDGRAHLLIPRFDDPQGTRVHQHTLGGLLHVDYNVPGASSYEEYLRTILRLGMAQSSIHEGFRRMLFNVLAINQDDHVKNLSFHMDTEGCWSLAPAYDLTYAAGKGFTARHQMTIQDKTEGIHRADLLAVAKLFGIRGADRMIERVEQAFTQWERAAESTGVPEPVVGFIREALNRRAESLHTPRS